MNETTNTQMTFIERITAEYDALAAKLQSLKLFMMTGTFKEMSRYEQNLLERQFHAMNNYKSVLMLRLDFYGVVR